MDFVELIRREFLMRGELRVARSVFVHLSAPTFGDSGQFSARQGTPASVICADYSGLSSHARYKIVESS